MYLVSEQILKQKDVHLVLLKGFDKENNPFHAFIVAQGNNFEKLKNHDGILPLNNYGTVLYSNYDHDVPECITEGVIAGFNKKYAT